MPNVSTCRKGVHFDTDLEHVRAFYQVDSPQRVSAPSSSIDEREDQRDTASWNVGSLNFETNMSKCSPRPVVKLEKIHTSLSNMQFEGVVSVANIAFEKAVIIRYTLDDWQTISQIAADFHSTKSEDEFDHFNFQINLADEVQLRSKTLAFCIKYCVNGREY
jgi:hypothetical protein